MDAYLKNQFDFTGVKAALLVEQSILVILRDNKPDIPWPNTWELPGGGREGDETYEEGTLREIKEEFGINVKIVKKLYEEYSEKFNQTTIYYLCEYVSGEFGTGTGPEFSNDPKYIDSGKYIPEIVKREDIERIPLMPPDIKEKFLEDIRNKKI